VVAKCGSSAKKVLLPVTVYISFSLPALLLLSYCSSRNCEKVRKVYLTYTHQNYWDRGSQDRYGLSMGHSFSFAGIQDYYDRGYRNTKPFGWSGYRCSVIHNPWSGHRPMASFSFAGIQGISTNLAAYRSEYQGKRDDSLSLSISVPWGDGRSMDYELQNSGNEK
jgi:outer membrane usher protein PapC